jgi:small-conductance mechanosensitive channel
MRQRLTRSGAGWSAPRALAQARSEKVRRQARRARREALVLGTLLAAILFAYDQRMALFGVDEPARIATVVALVAVGWAFARDIGRVVGPALLSRMDPASAGTFGFLIRLVTLVAAVLAALRIAGLPPRTLALGGAFTAVIFGLAAQQTLGNLIAGMMLLSARPFRVADRVRFQGGGLAGQVEGTVESLGLLYTTLGRGADQIMVPNAVVLSCAIVPLREPASVAFLARLRPDVRPATVQQLLDRTITVPTLGRPDIELVELDDQELVVRIVAVPVDHEDGPQLTDEVLAAVTAVTHGDVTLEHLLTPS